MQIWRLVGGRLPQLIECGEDRSALRMAEYHDEARSIAGGCEFDAADLRWSDDVPRDTNDEKIAQSLVEHDLRGDTGVGASEDDRERLLSRCQLLAAVVSKRCIRFAHAEGEATIPLAQPAERFARGDHGPAA